MRRLERSRARARAVCTMVPLLGLLAVIGVPGQAPAQDGTGGEALPSFDVWEYRVTGNTLLERTVIERTVYEHLGPGRTIEDVEAASRALEVQYKEAGYPTVLVNIPEQDVSEGVVHLEVIQGKVERLRVANSRYFSLGRIRKGIPALAEGKVPHFPKVQEQIADLNRVSRDRRITPVFRPGRRTGGVEAELRVEDRLPLHGSLVVDDRNTQNTSRTRASAGVRYTNLWQRHHTASVEFQVAPEDPEDSRVLSGTYLIPLPSEDLLVFYGVKSESDVATAGDITVIGDGTILGTRYIKPLPGVRGFFQTLTLGLDYKDFDEDVSLQDGGTLETPIDYLNFVAEYRGGVRAEHSNFSFNAGVNFGVRGLENSTQEFDDKRFQGAPNYFYFSLGAQYLRDFGAHGQVFAAADSQFSPSPLVSNEQFAAGGVDSVRGYFESQLLGDDGLNLSFELRSRSFAGAVSDELRDLRFHAFLDAAAIRLREPLPGQEGGQEIASAGLGMRVSGPFGLTTAVDWAVPLLESGTVGEGESRFHFSIEYEM